MRHLDLWITLFLGFTGSFLYYLIASSLDGFRRYKKEKKFDIVFFIFNLIFLSILASPSVYSGLKIKSVFWTTEKKIQKKINEITDLRQRLEQKQQEVQDLFDLYQTGIRKIKQEILLEKYHRKIFTYEQAAQNSQIAYDLSLIQRKEAYIQKLKEINLRLQKGTNELLYLEREAQDDLEMVKVLNSNEAEALVTEINKVIQKYLPDAEKLVINIDEKTLPSPQQIWEQIQNEVTRGMPH